MKGVTGIFARDLYRREAEDLGLNEEEVEEYVKDAWDALQDSNREKYEKKREEERLLKKHFGD
jgi:hypothetical protein